jgi:hypothetical protein
MGRMVASCTECGEEREIVAHGLCVNCYRRKERAEENPWAKKDRHAVAVRKAQRKSRKGLLVIMNALEDLSDAAIVSADVITAMQKLIKPEVARIADALDAPEPKAEPTEPEPEAEPVHVSRFDLPA